MLLWSECAIWKGIFAATPSVACNAVVFVFRFYARRGNTSPDRPKPPLALLYRAALLSGGFALAGRQEWNRRNGLDTTLHKEKVFCWGLCARCSGCSTHRNGAVRQQVRLAADKLGAFGEASIISCPAWAMHACSESAGVAVPAHLGIEISDRVAPETWGRLPDIFIGDL
jgi:hypothetical protein